MSPTPWNENKQVPNFAIGMQGSSRVENSGISRRSSNASDYEKVHITSSNDDLLNENSYSFDRGSKRLVPLSHPAVDVPLCMECQALQSTFFDPGCANCIRELKSVSHVMAALRQWVPQVQQSAEMLIETALKHGAHPDDRDAVTDMTLLMYACKSGAAGVGNTEAATRMTKKLISLGANLSCRCKWTDMAALHYASYFDVGPVLTALLITSKGVDVDISCQEYENGTALHIAAANLSLEAAKVLIGFDSDTQLNDELARMPIDCIPDEEDGHNVSDFYDNVSSIIDRTRKTSQNVVSGDRNSENNASENEVASIFARANDAESFTSNIEPLSMPSIATRVEETKLLSQKMRILLLKGVIGLHKVFPEENKNHKRTQSNRNQANAHVHDDGGVSDNQSTVCYSQSVSSLADNNKRSPSISRSSRNSPAKQLPKISNPGKLGLSNVVSSRTVLQALGLKLGDRVLVNETKLGTLEFCGPVDFSGGTWAGVELDEPEGKHDGTVNNVTYFTCGNDYGVIVPTNKIEKVGKNYRPKSPAPMGNPINKIVNHGKVDVSRIGSRITEAQYIIAEKAAGEIRVGDRVSVAGLDVKQFLIRQPPRKAKNYQPVGTIRFVGSVDFVDDGSRWYGVEMDDPIGRHDGTVQGVRYFAANDNHGVFVVDSKLTKIKSTPSLNQDRDGMSTSLLIDNARNCRGGSFTSDENLSGINDTPTRDRNGGDPGQSFSMNYHTLATNEEGEIQNANPIIAQNKTKGSQVEKAPKPRNPLRRSLSQQHRSIKANTDINTTPKIIPSTGEFDNTPPTLVMSQRMIISASPAPVSMVSRSSSRAGTGRLSRAATVSSAKYDRYGLSPSANADPEKDNGPGWASVSTNEFTKFTMKRSPSKKYLEPGTTVIYINTKEMALVKYVGRVSFTDGIWLGLELKQPRVGRHDGCVEGRRYFTCGNKRGVMVRPKTVSVHGINGSALIKPLSEYPF